MTAYVHPTDAPASTVQAAFISLLSTDSENLTALRRPRPLTRTDLLLVIERTLSCDLPLQLCHWYIN